MNFFLIVFHASKLLLNVTHWEEFHFLLLISLSAVRMQPWHRGTKKQTKKSYKKKL